MVDGPWQNITPSLNQAVASDKGRLVRNSLHQHVTVCGSHMSGAVSSGCCVPAYTEKNIKKKAYAKSLKMTSNLGVGNRTRQQ